MVDFQYIYRERVAMLRAVIADRNPRSRRAAARVLAELNVEVSEIGDREAFLNTVADSKPDLVIVDLDIVSLSQLKKVRNQMMPTVNILMTHSPGKLTKGFQGLLTVGNTDFLSKPFGKTQLLHRIRNLAALSPQLRISSAADGGKPIQAEPSLLALRDPHSGRLDANKMAQFLGIPLKALAKGLDRNYGAVHKTPSSSSLQPLLLPIGRILELLVGLVGGREAALAWLNTPSADLSGETPIALIRIGHADSVRSLLENLAAGAPT